MEKSVNSEVRRALCFGCWLQAGVLATVENGKVVKLKGELGNPVNQGWICERSKAFIEHLYHEDRLNTPLKVDPLYGGRLYGGRIASDVKRHRNV